MDRKEYYSRVTELSLQFVREKRARTIPADTAWAYWCLERGIYPLTPIEETPFMLTPPRK